METQDEEELDIRSSIAKQPPEEQEEAAMPMMKHWPVSGDGLRCLEFHVFFRLVIDYSET